MPLIVANCPRCGARHITMTVKSANYVAKQYGWQYWYECACVCHNCLKLVILRISQKTDTEKDVIADPASVMAYPASLNQVAKVEGYVSLRDEVTTLPPDHLPENIEKVFREAATCVAVECWNAAGAMFRLCVDLATKPLLPTEGDNQPNARGRNNLADRLQWLFDNDILAGDLWDLSSAVRQDGNDAAHAGTLTEHEAEDLLDFTVALLERLYTQPARLALAQERRDARRKPTN